MQSGKEMDTHSNKDMGEAIQEGDGSHQGASETQRSARIKRKAQPKKGDER